MLLQVAYALIDVESGKSSPVRFEKADFEKAVAPMKSLLSKSEKAKMKLKQDTWQYKMLEVNIAALNIALPLLLSAIDKQKGEMSACIWRSGHNSVFEDMTSKS